VEYAACLQPGVSVAAVALANGLNANYLRRWVKEHREQTTGSGITTLLPERDPHVSQLVPVTIEPPVAAESGEIRIDIRRGPATVQMAWPVGQTALLGQLLKDLLR